MTFVERRPSTLFNDVKNKTQSAVLAIVLGHAMTHLLQCPHLIQWIQRRHSHHPALIQVCQMCGHEALKKMYILLNQLWHAQTYHTTTNPFQLAAVDGSAERYIVF